MERISKVFLVIGLWAGWASGEDSGLRMQRLLLERETLREISTLREPVIDLSGQVQARYTLNTRRRQGSAGSVTNGFEGRRTKLKLSGRDEETDWRYTLSMAFSRRTGQSALEDAYVRMPIGEDWYLKVGRFRPSVLREQIVSSRYQLAAERSLLTDAFGQSYSEGIALQYRGEHARLTLSAMDTQRGQIGASGWAYIARGEFMLAGDRSVVGDFTSPREEEGGSMLGMSIGYVTLDPRVVGSGEQSTLTWSADLSQEFGGASMFLAVVGSHTSELGVMGNTRLGVLAQGGVYLSDDVELFARYTHGDDDEGGRLNVVEGGVNWYVHGHDVKLTCDLGIGLDPVSNTWRASGAGWRGDVLSEEGQAVIRVQLQVLF